MATGDDVTLDKLVTADELGHRLHALNQIGPLALFSDIDGTISPIASQPAAAFVLPVAVDALARLSVAGITVILVTGRAAADARSMVGLQNLGYAGNHGFELRFGDRHIVRSEVEAATSSIGAAITEVQELAARAGLEGILFEDKRYTGSVHYRLAPDPDEAKSRLLPILRDVVERWGLRLTEGRLVYEIRPSIQMNKGVFVAQFLETSGHGTAAFLGDDLTDVDGFRAVQAARASGGLLSGLNVGVTAAESPQQVVDEADVVVAGTSVMADALRLFADLVTEPVDV